MEIKIKTITPKMASAILTRNPANRNVRKHLVATISRDIAGGAWQMNGDAIRINADGELIDGQHRLLACIDADAPIKTVFITGMDDRVRTTIDSGARRTVGDRFAMAGVQNSNVVAAAVAYMTFIARQDMSNLKRATASESEAILAAHPELENSAHVSSYAFPGLGGKLTGIHAIGTYMGFEDRADAFVNVWKSGVPDYAGDPTHVMRERVVRTRGTAMHMTGPVLSKLLAKSWSLFVAMRPIEKLVLPDRLSIDGWDEDALFGRVKQ